MNDEVRRMGYLRVPLTDKHPTVQADALERGRCTEIYQTTTPVSTSESIRDILNLLGDGDALIVYRMDRLARDEHSLVNLQQQLEAMGAELITTEDLETAGGDYAE